MNVTYADARNGRKVEGSKEGRKEGRGKLLKGWEGGWMYTYIHTRTKINYYKPLPFAYSHQFILLSCAEIPIPKPNPRAPDKASSSLIYACRINLYLFPSPPTYLSSTLFPPFWTVSFHLLPRRVPASVPAAEPIPPPLDPPLDVDPDNEGPALSCANIFLDDCLHRRGAGYESRILNDEL